jgi:maltose alpha-D-glucosyltransferase / alpha-amylase
MQWTGDRNAGFSRADPARLFAPPIMDPVYGYQGLNVEAQERAPFSLLNWMKRMIGLRKQSKVFGRGTIVFLPAQNRKVLAYVRHYENETVLCLANLARSVQPVELNLSRFKGMTPVEMLGLTEFPRIGELPYFLTLGPYAFYWFRLQEAPTAVTARVAPGAAGEVPQAPALLVGAAWETLLEGNVRTLVERDLLLPFMQRQRWFGGKARSGRSARFVDWGILRRGLQPLFLTVVEVEFADGGREQYFLPLAISAHLEARGLEERAPQAVLANITGARKGVLFDAALDDRFARTLLEALEAGEQTGTKRGSVRAVKTEAFARLRGSTDQPIRISRSAADQSNSSILYGTRLILKLFRRLQPGINPDYEIGRQLTEKTEFTRVPAVAGALEYARLTEEPSTLAMMQQLVNSQGDGWTHATDEVQRFYEEVEGTAAPELPAAATYTDLMAAAHPDAIVSVMGPSLAGAETLGRRTAEMHIALASDRSNLAFAPEPFTKEDLAAVSAITAVEAQRSLDILESESVTLQGEVADSAKRLLQSRETLLERIRSAPALEFSASKIRVHGDYHLGQVLWVEGDYVLLDFEGEPARPIEQRRLKQSPLKDVAGMIRSYSYAAYAGLFGHVAARPAELERLEPWARIWQTWTTAAFLRGYFATAAGALFIPTAPSQRDALLELFVLDKVLYELNYELNNRPDWVRIPLRGIFDLLDSRL